MFFEHLENIFYEHLSEHLYEHLYEHTFYDDRGGNDSNAAHDGVRRGLTHDLEGVRTGARKSVLRRGVRKCVYYKYGIHIYVHLYIYKLLLYEFSFIVYIYIYINIELCNDIIIYFTFLSYIICMIYII